MVTDVAKSNVGEAAISLHTGAREPWSAFSGPVLLARPELEISSPCDGPVTPTIPPRVDYSLTDRGTELVTLLLPLFGWVVANADDIVGERGPAA